MIKSLRIFLLAYIYTFDNKNYFNLTEILKILTANQAQYIKLKQKLAIKLLVVD